MLTDEKRVECFNEILCALHDELLDFAERIKDREDCDNETSFLLAVEDFDISGSEILNRLIEFVGNRYFKTYLDEDNIFRVIEKG